MKHTKKSKPYWEMDTSELREATREFDQEFIADTFGPPDAAGRAQQRRARRGRPRIGEGCGPLLISMEQGMLRDLDAYVKRHKTTRSRALAHAVELLVRRRKAS